MASRYPASWLDELRARSDLVQIVSGYVGLKKSGRKYWGLCPFHGEKTASFSVDGERQLYYCFGCKAGGTVINFIMDIERMDFSEAVSFLAERAHMPLPELENQEEYERRRTQRDRLLGANRAAARFYHDMLYKPEGAASLEYLKKRGLSDGVITRYGLGAAPESRSALTDALLAQGYTLEELRLAGLTLLKSRGENGSAPPLALDMFRGRAMFPIIDQYGNVLAFGGRSLGSQQPKYLNTADTPVFNKRRGVYAANLLRKQRHLERVVLVEGYMDVISLSQFGVEGVCATLGTALTAEQARLLRRFAPRVYLGYDGDSAGQHAILRGLDILEAEGIPCGVLDFPDGLDPDEFIRRDGAEGFRSLPVIPPAAYRLLRLKDSHDLSTREGKISYTREAARVLAPLDPVERETYLRDLIIQTGFPRETLLEQLQLTPARSASGEQAPRKPVPVSRPPEGPKSEDLKAQELLISLLASGQIPEDIIEEKDFEDEELKSIYARLVRGVSVPSLIDDAPDEASRSRYSRILLSPVAQNTDQLITMASDCVARIRHSRLQRRRKELQQQLGQCPEDQKAALLQEIQQLSAQLRRALPPAAGSLKH